MKYSKVQKIISYFLLFLFFLNISVNIPPIFSLVLAKESSFYNLVSIIVDEKTYGEIKYELERYSKDISGVSENTKIVILPVSENVTPFQIASMNEAMFFDGYKSLSPVDFQSKLISTIFVGNIPLPKVYKGEDFTKTALPYVDFENKSYIFNKEKNRYEENTSGNFEIKPEIEFSFISPNTGSFSENIKSLKNFFEKDHKFYIQKGTSSNIKPYVFYYDYFREKQGLNLNNYNSYLTTRKNNEDLNYSRYTSDLLKKLSENNSKAKNEIVNLLKKIDSNISIPKDNLNLDVYDIQTRLPIENLKKNFLDSFSKGTLGELRKDVFNAGRYNFGQNVNVDFIPYLITQIDIWADGTLRKGNDVVEGYVDSVVDRISRKIAVPVSYEYLNPNTGESEYFENYLFGENTKDILNAEQCSFYRGSTQQVAANRGLNISIIQDDINRLKSMGNNCIVGLSGEAEGTNGLWGKNTPLFLDKNFSNGDLSLRPGADHNGAIEKLFDIKGAKKAEYYSKINPLHCFDNNFILDEKIEKIYNKDGFFLDTTYKLKGKNWSCTTDNNLKEKSYFFEYNFIENEIKNYNDKRINTTCDINIYLDDELVRTLKNPNFYNSINRNNDDKDTESEKNCVVTYKYKTVDSVIKHKAPLAEDIKAQAENMSTPNLPIDSSRYIDFIRADGKYKRIYYYDFFDFVVDEGTTLSKLEKSLKLNLSEYYWAYISKKIVLKDEDNDGEPSIREHKYYGTILDVIDKEDKISKKLQKGVYEKKEVGYGYPFGNELEFAILWNNLSTSKKYSIVFEKFLSRDDKIFTKKEKGFDFSNLFKRNMLDEETKTEYLEFLPGLKKNYEISYIGSPGNAQNLMIKFDPTSKENNPYSDILAKNTELSSKIFGNKITKSKNNKNQKNEKGSPFKCSPPDGVPLWEWPEAIECWIKDMLPPKINISEGSCSASSFVFKKENYSEVGGLLSTINGQNSVNNGNSCSIDENTNGISDCLESIDKLELVSDSSTYGYNNYINLTASFFQGEKKANFLNNTSVFFEIYKIEKAFDENNSLTEKNKEVIYDITKDSLKDKRKISEYLEFPFEDGILVSNGQAKNILSTKNKELNIFVRATSNNPGDKNFKKNIKSNDLKLEVRSSILTTSSVKYIKNSKKLEKSLSTIKASNKENIYIFDLQGEKFENLNLDEKLLSEENLLISMEKFSKKNEKLKIEYPINLKLLHKNNVIQDLNIQNRQEFIKMSPLSTTGVFTLKITDKTGFSTSREIYVVAGDVDKVKVDFGSNIVLSGGSILTNILTIYDKFDNPISGKNYLVELDLDKNFVFIDNSKGETNKVSYEIFEGYIPFRLKSLDQAGEGNISIKIKDPYSNKIILQKTEKLKSIKNLKILFDKNNFEVGGKKENFKITLVDEKGEKISNFNSRVYISGDENYFSATKSYFSINDGVSDLEIETNTIAANDIPLEIQIEGIGKIFNEKISILPGLPVKVDIILPNPKIEINSSTDLFLELKDRYNNIVFTDSSTKVKISVDDKFKTVLSGDKEAIFKNGKASLKLNSTGKPGTGFFKVKTKPELEKNSFSISDESKEIIVNGVSENVGKVETYYFWNKEKVEKQNYNSLYSVLVGSNYGDIEQQDYLAGSLIFNKDSQALAVTSLVENSRKKDNVLIFEKNGNIKQISNKNDLSQILSTSIGFEDGKIFLNLYNKSLNTNIGQIFFNLKNIDLGVCSGEFYNCFDKKSNFIGGLTLSSDYSFYKNGEKLLLKNNLGEEIFSVDKNGNFSKKSDFTFEIDNLNSEKYLVLDIKKSGKIIGKISISVKSDINVSSSSDLFNLKKSVGENSILLNIDSNLYNVEKTKEKTIISYVDPFYTKSSLNRFASNSYNGFENFENNSGIGWKDDNKTLLSFAAGKNVGAAVKDFMGIYTINIGDPFIKLNPIRKNFNGSSELKQFDSTIGEIISKNEDVVDYKVFDYNNDGRKDILLVKRDNYLELLENKNSKDKFLNHGNVVQIYDLGDFLEVGDFSGDKYDDIFFVGKDGKPYLLNNISKDFTRIDLTNKLNLNGKISQVSSFDMDNDGKKDLIILDESGELNIFYGGGTSANLVFIKNKISDGLGLRLDNGPRSDGGAIYFRGLYQPENNSNQINSTIDSEIYVNLPENQDKKVSDFGEIGKSISQKYFIKSEYFSSVGLDYKKIYKDRNGGVLASNDIVDIEITIKNNSGKTLTDINFQEKFEPYFNIDLKSIKNSKDLVVNNGAGYYNFSLKEFSLKNGESLVIKYSGNSKKLTYLKIETGFFEKGEIGDDKFGDIILDDLNLKCLKHLNIYKSTSSRSYAKGNFSETCDTTELPKEISKLGEDKNNNNVPDYIDGLSDKNNISNLKNYSTQELNNLNKDSDNDGIPDEKDFFDNINKSLDNTQELLDGLSCGFSNGGCISTPLNWAPLAPGSDPTFMGSPIGDGLNVEEGMPIFSALTGMYYGPYWGPSVWPISPLSFENDGTTGAGGRFGTSSPSNFFRIFVTPTLTGGIGTAICFGGPASTIGNSSNPFGIAPLLPGGNCIVLAKPLIGCSNDGSNGDPSTAGITQNYGNYGVVNAGKGHSSSDSCKVNNKSASIDKDYVKKYVNSNGGKKDKSILGVGVFKEALENHSKYDGSSLFNINLGGSGGFSVGLVPSGSQTDSVDFSDIEQIAEERIKSFPEFLMDWITRQIDEIISKLTDFPTLFIILPDFSGIYDSNKSWEENWNDYKQKSRNQAKNLNTVTSNVNNSFAFSNKISENLGSDINKNFASVNSGIREAYEFIGTLPIINLNQEIVNITIPWISDIEIDRTISSWKGTIDSWKEEIKKYADKGEYYDKFSLELDGLIGSVEKNIEILESYKKFPEEIRKLISKKEDYLYQILCNVEIISDLIGGWIGENGERFKAWIELYVLIKAILASWQSFIDIFIEFEQECKECKNERHDLLNFEFQVISMLVPDIPVVIFPKWPDIVLDLHNIRAGIDISIPEFEISTKPVNIPHLPNLELPDIPDVNAGIKLPNLNLLPEFKIPELPDLPSLPEIELPTLPPPPKLPKLFEGFEFIIDIAKLVTKALCILKSSPFHPEWRAGDQIAFLTERNGYMSFDFLSKSLPQFSIPFVDSIDVKSYVNLELETDFIVKLAEEIAKHINNETTDFTNKLNLDLNKHIPKGLEINGVESIDLNADFSKKTSYNDLKSKVFIGKILTNFIGEGVENLEKNKNEFASNEETKKGFLAILSRKDIASSSSFDDLKKIWDNVEKYSFERENEIIKSLQKFNFEKFNSLKNIIETERQKNRNLEKNFNEMYLSGKIKVSETKESLVPKYNQEMEKFNKTTFKNIGKLVNYDETKTELSEIEDIGNNLQNKYKNVFSNYSKLYNSENTPLENYKKYLLAANNNSKQNHDQGSCSSSKSSGYQYNYNGIYVLENNKSYRLFDYTEEVKGDEKTTPIDFDNDGDEDLLYFINNTLYLKENYSNENTQKFYLKEKPIILDASDNRFLKNDFIEAINNASETSISNSIINIDFNGLNEINNYRLSYFDIVDKYLNPYRKEIDLRKNKFIVDGISDSYNITKLKETEIFVERKDLVSIASIGNFKGFEMKTKKLKNIKDDLLSGKTVTISSGTKLYSGGSILDIIYKTSENNSEKNLRINPNTNIELKTDLIIVGITRGNGYVETQEEVIYNGDEISKLRGFPILFGTKIYFSGNLNQLEYNSYLDLQYYDNTEYRIDFNKIYSWELYDLGYKSAYYLFSLNQENNYYYAKINSFKNNKFGTSSQQILLSPQIKADQNIPEINFNSIKIPVYQEKEIDVTNKFIEDNGVNGISKVFIDFFLDVDSDGDGDPKNDDNNLPNLKIYKKDGKIFLKVGKFSTLATKKKIGLNVIDENGNSGFKELDFEVYAPIPEIETYDGFSISGKISEELKEEPINFYRFRGGNLSRLGDETQKEILYTNEKGEFSLKTGYFKGGLTIKDKSNQEIASISEKTGKITLNNFSKINYDIFVKTNKDTKYQEINIMDKIGKVIFSQVLVVKGNSKVSVVSNFENIEKNGIYVIDYKKSDLDYYILPENILNNPGVFVGFKKSDNEKNPILKIYPDGRLDLPDNFKINYSEYKDYINLKILDLNGNILFDVLYKLDADYIIN